MNARIGLLLWLTCVTFTVGAQSPDGSITTYQGCTDHTGKPVVAVLDTAIEGVVESRRDNGVASIHYNPLVLPRLRPEARLFLFAHECARHNAGADLGGVRDLEGALRADCAALDTLMRSRLIAEHQIAALQTDLSFSAAEWRRVPGPARQIALRACIDRNAMRPALSRPTPGQPDWNACVRRCGDSLRACRSPAPSCDESYDRCASLCDFRSPP